MSEIKKPSEDFTRRKFLTGVTGGLLASALALVSGKARAALSTADQGPPANDEQLKQAVKLGPLYTDSEQSAGPPRRGF